MIFQAVSNPIDTDLHPTVPPGYRWAVSTNEDPSDVSACLGAGWAPDESSAAWIADQSATIAACAYRMAGGTASVATQALDYDPIPAEADELSIGA